jgi:hypothetical protein
LAPPADRDKDKSKDREKSKRRPAPGARRPKPSGGSARSTRPSGGAGRKPPARSSIREAASEAAARRAAEKQETSDAADDFEDARTSSTPSETDGHSQWPDHSVETDSWDEAGGDGPGEGTTRTLGEWLEAVVPPEAQLHFFNAGREFAAGIQTTLDYHLHRDGGGDDGEGVGALRIDIE